MSSSSFPEHDVHADGWQHAPKDPKPKNSLTFVLPPLSAVRAQKSKKKIKLSFDQPKQPPKQPRPIKLKPLKEVLIRLIAQIKKKDDYAFFLQPVDLSQVPGYTDLVSKPMDLGTMTTKVEKGRYRSLEEFASDLKLVTGNAKIFNPPGSIYYTEAERIETYALEHIGKASATVIEYETDWNIDVERDDDNLAIDDDDTAAAERVPGTPMDVDGSRAGSPSVASVQAGVGRRGKGKKVPGTLTETLEADGGLPGAKDGLGAFPPGSDWAELMLALKLKGKRYRTKKERMRIEKGGPPLAADGSLDYPEMEDPFSVLSVMVPDAPSRPYLTPLYAPSDTSDTTRPPLPAPTSLLPLPLQETSSGPSASSSSQKSLRNIKSTKRRHWVVNRNAPSRRIKDTGEEEVFPAWKTPRETVVTDFGTFADLPRIVIEERKVRDVAAELGTEAKLFDALRTSLTQVQTAATPAAIVTKIDPSTDVQMETGDDASYWNGQAAGAEAYIRDVVYGGTDGFAYVRSVAEFLTPSEPVLRPGEPPTYGELGMPVSRWVEQNVIDPLTGGRHGVLRDASHILNTLPPTPPHSPCVSPLALPPCADDDDDDPIRTQVHRSLFLHPRASRALAALQAVHAAKIDLPALIRAPDELFRAEDVWAGREYRERRRQELDEALARDPEKNAAAYLQWAIAEHREAEAEAEAGAEAAPSASASALPAAGASVGEDSAMLAYALQVAADELMRLAGRRGGGEKAGAEVDVTMREGEGEEGGEAGARVDTTTTSTLGADEDVVMKMEEEEDAEGAGTEVPPSAATSSSGGSEPEVEVEVEEPEDPELKQLRLNLLALAKRAPLDQIMKLPPALVPAHLRHIVPTLDA